MTIDLFPREKIIGIFRGFQEGGLEFHADLVLPYRNDFQSIPMNGQFLLVQLETPNEAVLGRITSFHPEGKLSTGSGDEFNIRAVQDDRPIPEDLRERYLRYRVNIRVLGVLRSGNGNGLTYVPSVRRLPHVGSPVAFASEKVLQEIAGHNIIGAPIGYFALGEFVYSESREWILKQDWIQFQKPEVLIKFPIQNLVARRTFIFARAGFGKSNLNKLLFSKLYEQEPKVLKRKGKSVPVGTVIFDPDGEYFWPDDRGRPGLCDVPGMEDKLVVFTSRKNPSNFYQSFVAGGVKLDIRRFSPADVIAIALSPEKQDQQNVRKLRQLSQSTWHKLVDLIAEKGNQAPIDQINSLLGLEDKQEAEAYAARANMTSIVHLLHDKTSRMMDMLMKALSDGKLCVVDVSQMRGGQALVLSGLILRRIFDHNQEEFTKAEPKTIPTIVVIEEAQSVLNERTTTTEPYISWVKEGRKYDLGAVMVTQQPGSIPTDILSQGDNWFIFHLLSAADLVNVKKANAHFSDDLLTALLNEPIPGQGVFWSSVGGKPYPVSLRVLSFEEIYRVRDPDYNLEASDTYAAQLREHFTLRDSPDDGKATENGEVVIQGYGALETEERQGEPDFLTMIKEKAITALRQNKTYCEWFRSERGLAWGAVKGLILRIIPEGTDNADNLAYSLVKPVLEGAFGPENDGWHTISRPNKDGISKSYVREGRANN